MAYRPENPVIIQSDRTVLLEVDHPRYEESRDALARFAELEKSPEHVHTYRISPLSLWNAASSGMTVEEVVASLEAHARYDVPKNIVTEVKDVMGRYGRLKLERVEGVDGLVLSAADDPLVAEVSHQKSVTPYLLRKIDARRFEVAPEHRGLVKQALIKVGYPVEDLAGYVDGAALPLAFREKTASGRPFQLRDYQRAAVDAFYASGSSRGGSGILVLPCGAGKTVIGIGGMVRYQMHTLIVCTNITAARQWRSEILDKTTLLPDQIGEYSGESKEIRPVTIATYQILTYRREKGEAFVHFDVFNRHEWGLILYDEVHLLPAPVFRAVAEIQAKRRLGLTATLVREDGREDDVFSLIGPKRYDAPWKDLERRGWIAKGICTEVRVALDPEKKFEYAVSEDRAKFRLAATNPKKLEVIPGILALHANESVLVIGQYLDQLDKISYQFKAPIITGKTPNKQREKLYKEFKDGLIRLLIVSKVANFAVDLPEASVAIQVSGTFGSRQEEAQRLGRVLRPKSGDNLAYFYSLVTRDTKEQDFAFNRQLFLTEEGYRYEIRYAEDGVAPALEAVPPAPPPPGETPVVTS